MPQWHHKTASQWATWGAKHTGLCAVLIQVCYPGAGIMQSHGALLALPTPTRKPLAPLQRSARRPDLCPINVGRHP